MPIFPPLPDRIRPDSIEGLVGLDEIIGEGRPLRQEIESGNLHSTLLWGPPGSGKTTLVRIIARRTTFPFVSLSAVLSSIKEVKEVMGRAKNKYIETKEPTLLFIDELHRFNKAQQDAFLPYVEEGTVVLFGTTTENPSFYLTPALISRMNLIKLAPLTDADIEVIVKRAVENDEIINKKGVNFQDDIISWIASLSSGDARFALIAIETISMGYPKKNLLNLENVKEWWGKKGRVLYDRSGEGHYNLISALHKSIRNSNPQAALHYMGRMIESGENPLYIVRRLVRAASEDIGLADPNALTVAIHAKEAFEFLGSPEGELAIAEAVIYLSCAPKSNRVYLAMKEVESDLKKGLRPPVPLHLCNPVTSVMEKEGYGEGYIYAHDEPEGIADMECLPSILAGRVYYEPKDTGFEKKIKEWLTLWQERRIKSKNRKT